MGDQMDSQGDGCKLQVASCKKSHFIAAFRERKYQRKQYWDHLRQLALCGHTDKNVRSIACKFELDLIERKLSQVNISRWPNGGASYG